ncbi:MAG TPA: DUF1707 domain-containing protein [Gaiellaceae bacterium]|nr:DUF1707 domain-containing protein [Gaiellaceae bacterium]
MTGRELEVRASDAEREQTVSVLRRCSAEGRLTVDEFADRIDRAYAARTRGELEALVGDLPAETAPGAAVDSRSRRRPKRLTLVAFGSVERTGRWRLPGRGFVGVVFGNADVDTRRAELDSPVASLTAFVLFGNADFYVPEGVDVDLAGIAVFGHRREFGSELPVRAGAPLLRIRVFSLFGTADVWRVPHAWVDRTFGEVIRALKRGEHKGELNP